MAEGGGLAAGGGVEAGEGGGKFWFFFGKFGLFLLQICFFSYFDVLNTFRVLGKSCSFSNYVSRNSGQGQTPSACMR